MRAIGGVRYLAGKILHIKSWCVDQKEEKAREYRKKQQVYINKMLDSLRERVENGDETPSILGNILRQKLLKDEEVLLASYTGSMLLFPSSYHFVELYHLINVRETVAAGVNLGYSLTWIIGYLANRPDLQKDGYEAIREVYNGEAPMPHEFDRVEFVKALHTVSISIIYVY